MSRPAALAAASASMQRASSRSAGSSPSQRATPADAVWPRGVERADAVEHLAGLAEPAVGQDQAELGALEAGERVDLAQLGAPARGGLLDQAVALLLAAQHVEGAQVVEVDHGDGQRRLAAAGAGDLARQLVVPRAAGRQAGQRVRERERADARAQLLALDRDRGLGGQHAEHLRDRVGHGVDRVAPDQDQHAGDLVAAQHGLEQRRARARSPPPAAPRAPGGCGRRPRSRTGAR